MPLKGNHRLEAVQDFDSCTFFSYGLVNTKNRAQKKRYAYINLLLGSVLGYIKKRPEGR